ncbi:MAG: sulfur carrier protein ThiS [Acidobacteriota bacterium]|nr:MAG: sulfur carrier protein ThiS [Acidobacteriota bacterium]
MKIVVNGEPKEVPLGLSLQRLIEHLEIPTERVAVELNLDVVPKAKWPEVDVKEEDKLEIIHFVGGG